MAAVAPDLRPRGPAELYDAAVHLCTRGGTPLPALAVFGAVLPAVSGLALAQRALTGRSTLAFAAAFAACLMARGIFAGAASLAAEACLEGSPVTSWAALRKALARGPSLASAGGLAVLIEWCAIPASLFIGLALWSQLWAGLALVARGEAGPWSMARACRKRLANEPTFVVRLLHAVALVVVVVNLLSGIAMALYLARALLALDVTFFDQFASLKNPVYDLFVVALSFVALEPVKVALGLLLLVDSRVRSEGLDLRAAVDRLAARRAAKGLVVAAALLAALSVTLAPAAARATSPRIERDLAELMDDAGLAEDNASLQGFEAARRLQGPDAVALGHFVDRLRRARDAGESPDALRRQLADGLSEARALGGKAKVRTDPRVAAQAILAQSEFEPVPEHPKDEELKAEDKPKDDSLLMRFLRWLGRWLEKLFKSEDKHEMDVPVGGLGAGAFRVLTYVLFGLALAILAFVIGRALLRHFEEKAEAEQEEGAAAAGGAAKEEVESALAKAPQGWFSDADALAARGDFRAAQRALYLAVLSALHRRGAIEYDPTRSNWDYVRAFRGALEEKPPFGDLTRRFDFAWYGRLGADGKGYEAARSLAGPLIEKGAAADA